MPTGDSRSRARFFLGILAVVITCVFLGLIFRDSDRKTGSSPAEPSPAPSAKANPKKAAPTPLAPDFEVSKESETRGFALVLNQAVIRQADGNDRIVPLTPPATPSTLRTRLRELDPDGRAFPLCRETQAPDTAPLRIVTSEILLKLTSKEAEEPPLPLEIKRLGRPDYAPEYLLIAAADPFAALEILPELRRLPAVEGAEVQLASWQTPRTMPTDPLIAQQWHLKFQSQAGAVANSDIRVENAWLYDSTGGVKGTGIRVGVVDDGLETTHPDLAANVDNASGKDWNGNDLDPNPGHGDNHGTACAGNVASPANNSFGGCGSAPESTLIGMRLIAAATTDSQEAEAMNYLATGTNLIHIKTNSWGPSDTGTIVAGPGSLTQAALTNATHVGRNGLGTIFLWAGGNGNQSDDDSNYDGYANDPHVIAIGASDSLANQAYYCEPGANLTCVAPSGGAAGTLGITTTDRTGKPGYNTANGTAGDYTTTFSGTSSATPTAAGVIALMLQKNPALGWRDVKEILIRSAQKISSTDSDWSDNSAGFHFNHKFGAGLIDATAAVNVATHWIDLPPAISTSASLTGLPASIPDNTPAGITRTFAVSSAVRVEHVALTLDITHPYRGDLAITLTSPSGMTSRLAEVHNDGGNNYHWTFSSVRHWGESSTGTWTLKIADVAAVDIGTLDAATLTLSGAPTTFTDWTADFAELGDQTTAGDPDQDGLPNLVEYYLGGRPDSPDQATRSPKLTASESALSLDWWHPKIAAGVSAIVETSNNLAPDSWSPANGTGQILTDTGNAEHHQMTVPIQANESPKFLRLKVTAP
jgi:subtilisin-like proprotein convertase family protein